MSITDTTRIYIRRTLTCLQSKPTISLTIINSAAQHTPHSLDPTSAPRFHTNKHSHSTPRLRHPRNSPTRLLIHHSRSSLLYDRLSWTPNTTHICDTSPQHRPGPVLSKRQETVDSPNGAARQEECPLGPRMPPQSPLSIPNWPSQTSENSRLASMRTAAPIPPSTVSAQIHAAEATGGERERGKRRRNRWVWGGGGGAVG